MKQTNRLQGGYKSELSPARKKKLYIGLGIFVLSFVFLKSIGSDINQSPYLIRAFLASFFLLVSIIYIPYVLIKDENQSSKED